MLVTVIDTPSCRGMIAGSHGRRRMKDVFPFFGKAEIPAT
jgi:hypothetical protein